MTGVQVLQVKDTDGEQRLDRWFKRYFPGLGHGQLEKLLRTGQVRVDGGRAKAATRVNPGMMIRVPPLDAATELPSTCPTQPRLLRAEDVAEIRSTILFIDDDVIAINKPAGLAVQGGTGTSRHLDGMLDALRFDAEERPKLVHRLDKETTGVLLLARSSIAARWLTTAFREKTASKVYWAAVVGLPKPQRGRIDLPVGKPPRERNGRGRDDDDDGMRDAATYYTVVDHAAQKASWLALMPVTGRTHQLRIHCAAIGTPILGDDKYGGGNAEIDGLPQPGRLHLHAHSIRLRRPNGVLLDVTAPLSAHMISTWDFLGWPAQPDSDPFAELDLGR